MLINNKKGATIAEHLVTEWFKHHGPPKYIMSDRGNEFLNAEVEDLCQFYGIKYTTTAAYSPHQNGLVERGHATADRALERKITADPCLKPQVPLAWVIYATNTMQNVNGYVPFQLVFGRLPRHPLLVEDNPEANEVIADPQAQWARHYRTMMAAKEHFIAVETDSIIRKALKQRIYTNPTKINDGDWMYFRRNQERYWKGPAKVALKDGKSLHCIMQGNPLITNSDDVLLNKPSVAPEFEENFTFLPIKQQPPASTISGQLSQPRSEAGLEQPKDAKDVIVADGSGRCYFWSG